MQPTQFIDRVKTGAINGWVRYGVLPSLSIAQAILESGWGESALATQGKALFGIKATASWKGKVWTGSTREEYSPGSSVYISAGFRAYDTWDQSIEDHGKFLSENSRYHGLLGQKDYRRVCVMIKQAGYATASNYTQQLISLIEQYKLMDIDNIAFTSGPIGLGQNVTVETTTIVHNVICFAFNIKNDSAWNPGTIYYYDGETNRVKGFHNEEEFKYFMQTFEETTGLPLKVYSWDAKFAPVYARLFGVLNPIGEKKEEEQALWKLQRYTDIYRKAYGDPTHFTPDSQLAIRDNPAKRASIIGSTVVGTKYKVLETVTRCDYHWAKVEITVNGEVQQGWFTMGNIIGDWYGEQHKEY